MVFPEGANPAERQDAHGSRFELATTNGEARSRAHDMAEILVLGPEQLTSFGQAVEEANLLARYSGDLHRVAALDTLVDGMIGWVQKYDWRNRADQGLTPTQTRALLLRLPQRGKREQTVGVYQSRLQKLSRLMAAGFLSGRFEENHNWRGAVSTIRVFLEGALVETDDLPLLTRWFDLMVGKYPKVMAPGSLAWRSLFLAARAADPKDEEYLGMAAEIDWSTGVLAQVLRRYQDFQRKTDLFKATHNQFVAAMATYMQVPQGPEAREWQVRYFKQAGASILPPADVLEVVESALVNGERFAAIDKVIEWNYQMVREDTSATGPLGIQMRETLVGTFPFTVQLKDSDVKQRLGRMVDATLMRPVLFAEAAKLAELRTPPWAVVPFALSGMRGYALVPPDMAEQPRQEQLRYVQGMILKHAVGEVWQSQLGEMSPAQMMSAVQRYEDVEFIMAQAERGFVAKTELETMLDLVIPDERRRENQERMKGIARLQVDIPERFGRSPTSAGDIYDILNHPDLPGVFDTALVKSHPEEGYQAQLRLAPALRKGLPKEMRSVIARIDFSGGRANVRLEAAGRALAEDLSMLLTRVVLAHLEKSCCPPIWEAEEREDELGQLDAEGSLGEGEGIAYEVPGKTVHVGARTKSGEPGKYSEEADIEYKRAMGVMPEETGGVSLALVNARHRIEEPQCQRFLTWRSGYKVGEGVVRPMRRQAPEHIL